MKTLVHILVRDLRGGCERDALMVCANAVDWNHVVLIITDPGEMTVDFEEVGAAVQHLRLSPHDWLAVIANVERALSAIMPSAIISWHGMVLLPQICYAARNLRVPLLVHGGNPAYTLPWWVDIRYLVLGALLPRGNMPTYFCCSKYVEESFSRSLYLRRFSRSVIPSGVEVPAESHSPRDISAQGPLVIGMLARLDGIKDHATLLRAFSATHSRWPAATLEILGDGALRHDLECLARDLGVEHSVKWHGSRKDIYRIMRNWDIFAYATTEREGLGNALIEAMMLGLPCIASDVGPIREVSGEPPVLELVPPSDEEALAEAIIRLAQSGEDRRRLSAIGRDRARREFSPEIFSGRVTNLIDELSARQRSRNALPASDESG